MRILVDNASWPLLKYALESAPDDCRPIRKASHIRSRRARTGGRALHRTLNITFLRTIQWSMST